VPDLAARSSVAAFGASVLFTLLACDSSPTSPTPGPTPVGPAVLVGAGDIADCTVAGSEATGRLLDAIEGTVMALGDLAYPHGRPEDFQSCFVPRWGRHKSRIRPIPGNHDYETPGASGYYAYMGSGSAPPDGYYSFRHGAWLVVALNTEIPMSAGSPQHEWLRRELANNPATCTAALMHYPLYTSGEYGPHPEVRPLWELLYQAGADVVVSGDEHQYERFAPQDPNGRADALRGLRQFVVGTGGAPLYRFVGVLPNSEAQLRNWGVLRLTLSDGSYTWEFVPVAGESGRDSGSAACH
jgi:hypothetical protein